MGYAFSIQDLIVNKRLRISASVFTAELNAILAFLSHLTHRSPRHNYLLLTDSFSSLQAIWDLESTNLITQPIVLQILSTIQSSVIFIWIPGHIGNPQDDRVDQAAKEATRFPKILDPTPASLYDLKNLYRHRILDSWHNLWKNLHHDEPRMIKHKPEPWFSAIRNSRHEEVILARLRIGHTRLTHSYLLQGLHAPPSCLVL